MTEKEIKELAREYIDNCTARAGFVILTENIKNDFIDLFVAGFMKCLELNKEIKWHKVAHGDLPSEEGGWVCNQDGLPCYFDWGTEQWLECEGTQIRTTEWCHMPHKE